MSTIETLVGSNPLVPPLPGSSAEPPRSPQTQFGAGGMRPDNGIPRFEMKAVRQADGTYVNVEFVDILTPGDPKAMPRHKVTDRLRDKYRPWYDQWRAGLTMAPSGTPLEMWPIMTPAQVMALKAVNIFTVEQLSTVADSNLYLIPMGITLRQNARTWLASKKESDVVERQTRENETMRQGMAMLEAQVAALSAQLAASAKQGAQQTVTAPALSEKRGPGRPRLPPSETEVRAQPDETVI